MRRMILSAVLAGWVAMLWGGIAQAQGLVSLNTDFLPVHESDPENLLDEPVRKGFTLPGPGTLVLKLWVSPHLASSVNRPFQIRLGDKPIDGQCERVFEYLFTVGRRDPGVVDGLAYYLEVHWRIEVSQRPADCAAIISPPQWGKLQGGQGVEAELEYYPPGVKPPLPKGAHEKGANGEWVDQARKWQREAVRAMGRDDPLQALDKLTLITTNRGHGGLTLAEMAEVHYQMAKALGRLERNQEALDEAEVALGLDPYNATFHHTRGWWLMKKSRWEEALAECHQAIRLDPNNLDAYHTLAVVQEEWARWRGDKPVWSTPAAYTDRPRAKAVKRTESVGASGRSARDRTAGQIKYSDPGDQMESAGASGRTEYQPSGETLRLSPNSDSNRIKNSGCRLASRTGGNYLLEENDCQASLRLRFSDSRLWNRAPTQVTLTVNVANTESRNHDAGLLVYRDFTVVGRSGQIFGWRARINLDVRDLNLGSGSVELTLRAAGRDALFLYSVFSGRGPELLVTY